MFYSFLSWQLLWILVFIFSSSLKAFKVFKNFIHFFINFYYLLRTIFLQNTNFQELNFLKRMPLRLDVKRKLLARSDRIKSVDLHPTEQWMLVSLYNGNVHIWNYENQQLVKSFEICELPVRSARFVARKNWIVTGSDDMHVRVFNYNTLERVHQFEAHSDYLRSIAVHPTQSFLLTSSDDMLIKLWDWDNKWQLKQTFEG